MIRFVFIALIFLAACTQSHRPPKDTLVVALGAEPSTLDPRFATDANGMRIGALIFGGLVRVGDGFKAEPDAAERWTRSGSLYSFYLRRDLKFHNGRALTAEDVHYSFEQFRKPGSPFASLLDSLADVRVRLERGQIVVDIRVRGAGDKFLLSDLPAVRLIPKKEIETAPESFQKQWIGSGPFRFESQSQNEIRLRAVRAKIPNLVFKIVRDDLTRFQKILKGEVDFAQAELPPSKIRELKERTQDIQVYSFPGLTTTYMLVNFKDPLLRRKDVREALARTIDRQELIAYKLYGFASEATSILTPINPYFAQDLSNLPVDLARAQKLIQEAGLQGQSLTLKTSNSPQAIGNGRVLAHQMSQSGLTVQLQSFEWGTFYSDVKKGNFQLAALRWVGTVDPDLYRLAFHSRETPPGRNRGSYSNQQLDRLLDQAAGITVPELRKKIYGKVQKTVHEDLAVIPLWYDQQVAVVRSEVEGFKPSLTSDFWPLIEVYKR